jgi:hypothetical protein
MECPGSIVEDVPRMNRTALRRSQHCVKRRNRGVKTATTESMSENVGKTEDFRRS